MTKTQIKELALASYKNNELSWEKVKKILIYLNKPELKYYIKIIKTLENRKTVTIVVPKITNKYKNEIIKKFSLKYKNKTINIIEDPELIFGIKIIDHDLVYEYNLSNTLRNIKEQIIK